MARSPVLGGFGLNPFGGAGVDFGAFDISGSNKESNLILTKARLAYDNGQLSDTDMKAALAAYAGTLDPGTSQQLNAMQDVKDFEYRVERDILANQVESGAKSAADLVAYDQGKLSGLRQDTQEYRQRLNTLQSSQNRYFSDIEDEVTTAYQDGQMTTTQLSSWYSGQAGQFGDNPDLQKAITKRVGELADRIVGERDTKMMSDYSRGKVAPTAFIAYATQARARYAAGTTDYDNWTQRLDQAGDDAIEGSLMYRYDLSQKYARLQEFVKSNAGGGSTGQNKGRTSTSKRTILGADGKWKTVTTTKHTAGAGPTANESAAYHNRQVEVADAKRQMKEIAKKLSTVGGALSTGSAIKYYKKQLVRFAKGSQEWYAVQGKLDSLNDRKHAEAVLKKEGIKISYPGASSGGGGGSGGSHPAAASSGGGGGYSSAAVAAPTAKGKAAPKAKPKSDTQHIDPSEFLTALGGKLSSGSYTARNKTTGAYGKYQIPPKNWTAWATKYLGDPTAVMTPENQEKVAAAHSNDLYNQLGDWRAVAHAWVSGGGTPESNLNPDTWSAASRATVDTVMGSLGLGKTSGSSLEVQHAKPKKPLVIVTGIHAVEVQNAFARVNTEDEGPRSSIEIKIDKKRVNFPTGLDASAFQKFYTQYEKAYRTGAEGFSISTPKGEVHYYVGDDPAERLAGMHELDTLSQNLYKEKMHAYKGSPSEITAANQYNQAVKRSAQHALWALDTESTDPSHKAGPIPQGLKVIEDTKAAIAEHTRLAQEAFKRTDVDAAYAQLQMASDLRGHAEAIIGTLLAQAQMKIAGVEAKYGLDDQAVSGKPFQGDLAKLAGFSDELTKTLETDAYNKLSDEISHVVVHETPGDLTSPLVFDQRGSQGQIPVNPAYRRIIGKNGTATFEEAPTTGLDDTGNPTTKSLGDEHLAKVTWKTGSFTAPAFTKYTVGQVGVVKTKDGQMVPLQGKVVSYIDADGKQQTFVENPFTGKWSDVTGGGGGIVYSAPAGFKSVPAPQKVGGTAFEYGGQGQGDNSTFHMELDEKTGTYLVYKTAPGVFGQKGDPELLGVAGVDVSTKDLKAAGWGRDYSGIRADANADLPEPFLGMDTKQVYEYRHSGLNAPDTSDPRYNQGPRWTPTPGQAPSPDPRYAQGPRWEQPAPAGSEAVAASIAAKYQGDSRVPVTLNPLKPLAVIDSRLDRPTTKATLAAADTRKAKSTVKKTPTPTYSGKTRDPVANKPIKRLPVAKKDSLADRKANNVAGARML